VKNITILWNYRKYFNWRVFMKLKKVLKTERNSKCECGSGKKYKKCCLIKEYEQEKKQRETYKLMREGLENKI